MMRPNPSRRFFPKEVAFLFGLFVLNAVLMFVVGLSVGKSWVPRAKAPKPPATQAAMGVAQPPVPAWTPDKWKNEMAPQVYVKNASPVVATKPPVPATQATPAAPVEKNLTADVVSFPKGNYTVQVGSYLSEPEANERIDELKKLGFPHAYFSAKELGDPKMVWYRVWLGYFPTPDAARKGGEWLQKHGEVKSYLVRKHDPNG